MTTLTRRIGLFILVGGIVAGIAYATWLLAFRSANGTPDTRRFDSPVATHGPVSYDEQIKPLLEKRCVVCHACYDAPCQLKLGSWEGITRGLSTDVVYNGDRLKEAAPTRLFTDAQRASEWRERGFSPVLNEYRRDGGRDRSLSLLYRVLAMKAASPQAVGGLAPATLDVGINRAQSCPRIETFDLYEKTHPEAGMPFALPGLSAQESELITRWLDAGAPGGIEPALSEQALALIGEWERFLNGESPKAQLVARYLYEHLFLAHLYLSADQSGPAFRLVRSRTPPGQPTDVIATRRPFEDPGVARVYYRLEREREPIVAKTHMPYRFDRARMARYTALFMAPDYAVGSLPDYTPELAANGLASFRALPEDARYRFMLDDANYFIMTFIKGPVCRGQVALNVIEDRFWVFFFSPEASAARDADDIARRAAQRLPLPAADGSDRLNGLDAWMRLSAREKEYQEARVASQRSFAARHGGPTLAMVWDGAPDNANAALTVFRHFDNASVVRGLVGDEPKTVWVLDYSLFERIYYLLAAGFDVFGNLTHNLNSRLYMDFLRMEGEANFLGFLPIKDREALIGHWYRDARGDAPEQMRRLALEAGVETRVRFAGSDAKREMLDHLAGRLAPVLDRSLAPEAAPAAVRPALKALGAVQGAALDLMPELSHLALRLPDGRTQYVTLMKDTGHKNVTHLLLEAQALAPEDNRLTVVPGLIGAYPNALFRLDLADVPAFVAAMASLKNEADYARLSERFAVRRGDARFWEFSDALMRQAQSGAQEDGGLLDYGRLENR